VRVHSGSGYKDTPMTDDGSRALEGD
jgi:hypothetical protein